MEGEKKEKKSDKVPWSIGGPLFHYNLPLHHSFALYMLHATRGVPSPPPSMDKYSSKVFTVSWKKNARSRVKKKSLEWGGVGQTYKHRKRGQGKLLRGNGNKHFKDYHYTYDDVDLSENEKNSNEVGVDSINGLWRGRKKER